MHTEAYNVLTNTNNGYMDPKYARYSLEYSFYFVTIVFFSALHFYLLLPFLPTGILLAVQP